MKTTAAHVSVVRAQAQDLVLVKDLFREIDREAGEALVPRGFVEQADGIEASLRHHDFTRSDAFWIWLARAGPAWAGYATAARIPKLDRRVGVLYLDEIYVLQRFRRLGAGSALLDAVFTLARELGCWKIRLNADRTRRGLRRFYERNGFRDDQDGFFQKCVTPVPPAAPSSPPPPSRARG